jgi:lipopolysaccharide/colanic/teichoic acid biosynthesis glycosyltransferase
MYADSMGEPNGREMPDPARWDEERITIIYKIRDIVGRVRDLVLGSLLLVLAAPLILALMVAVKLTSRGPAIYSQRRVGLRGAPFTIYKIRTMAHDCERATGSRWSTAADARITPLGRVLRRTHLDELPQLWNVLRGEMSLVGPRPDHPERVAHFDRIPELRYRDRLAVRPGITGLAQIQLPADLDSDLEGVRDKLLHDFYYVKCHGFILDLKILTCTVAALCGVPFVVLRSFFKLPNSGSIAHLLDNQESLPSVSASIVSPRSWRIITWVLPPETRVRVLEPAHQELLEDYIIKYNNHYNKYNINLHYKYLIIIMIIDCYKAFIIDKIFNNINLFRINKSK